MSDLARALGSNWEIALPYNCAVLSFAAYFVYVLMGHGKSPGFLELATAVWVFGMSLASIRSETSHTVFFDVSCRFTLATVGWGLCTLFMIQIATRHSTSYWIVLSSRFLRGTVAFTLLFAPLFALGLWNTRVAQLVFCLRYGCFWASLQLVKTKPFAFMNAVYGPVTMGLYLLFRIYPELWLLTPCPFFQRDENFRVDLFGQCAHTARARARAHTARAHTRMHAGILLIRQCALHSSHPSAPSIRRRRRRRPYRVPNDAVRGTTAPARISPRSCSWGVSRLPFSQWACFPRSLVRTRPPIASTIPRYPRTPPAESCLPCMARDSEPSTTTLASLRLRLLRRSTCLWISEPTAHARAWPSFSWWR